MDDPVSKKFNSKSTSTLLFFFLSVFVILSLWFYRELNQSQKQRHLSHLAADELRQSSDDLTRMVRTYVTTKDPRYEKMYWDILAIRNGEKARPIRYENIYWDFIASTNKKPRADGPKISLLEMMKGLGFTKEEFAKLASAEKHSSELVKTEMIAMHAMKGHFLDAEGRFTSRGKPDYEYARSILFNEAYHKDKLGIMTPIDEFFVMVDARTEAKVTRDMIYTYISVFLVYVTIVLLLWLSKVELSRLKTAQIEIAKLAKFPSEAPNPILRIQHDGRVIYNNRASNLLLESWGCKSSKKLTKNWFEIVQEVLKSNKVIVTEHQCENLIYSLNFTPIIDMDYVNIYANDITQGKMAEKEMLKKDDQLIASNQQLVANEQQREGLVKMLEFKNKELQDIVYTTSHDLKSPLVNIQGFSEELEKNCEQIVKLLAAQLEGTDKSRQINELIKEDIPQSLGFITSSASKMGSLLDGLLQVSRVGTAKMNCQPVDMDKAIAEVLAGMEHQIKEKKVTVAVKPLIGCIGDADMLHNVFTNLIGNAIKYFDPARPGEIEISGKVENNMSVYCVADNGVGIEVEHQKKVFDVFYRLNPHDKVGGEGLGLTIVTRILNRLDGQIRLESELDKGSKFFVSLPTVKEGQRCR